MAAKKLDPQLTDDKLMKFRNVEDQTGVSIAQNGRTCHKGQSGKDATSGFDDHLGLFQKILHHQSHLLLSVIYDDCSQFATIQVVLILR